MGVYTIVDLQYIVRGMIARIPELNHIAVVERWPSDNYFYMDPGEEGGPANGAPKKYYFFHKHDIDADHMAWVAEWDLTAKKPCIFKEPKPFRKTDSREYINLVGKFIEGLE